ncbi:MAG: extracellular solute-binding protein [Erysipelotrichia bacterium]|nr:extracellular solute-binding protein [Erysipelotrichia bacterium]
MKRNTLTKGLLAGLLTFSAFGLYGCTSESGSSEKVVIYSNADDEAVDAMKKALDNNGYKDEYLFQTFGTSELGGKLLAEGTNIEADIVTMSTFYVESAQEKNKMFQDLTFDVNTNDEFISFGAPITAQEGAIIVNTEMLKENNLEAPKSIKDLTDPKYKGFVSITDIASSSTAWLLVQALVDAYGEEETTAILKAIYENAGDHIEESGSAPLKKVRAGEVAIGFGLRHQAVADKEEGLPIDFIDAQEGTFSLTECVSVVDKGDKTNEKAMDMVECIIENGREELLQYYPVAIYEGEKQDNKNKAANEKVFKEKLTVSLLEKHQALSEAAKK